MSTYRSPTIRKGSKIGVCDVHKMWAVTSTHHPEERWKLGIGLRDIEVRFELQEYRVYYQLPEFEVSDNLRFPMLIPGI